VISQQDVEACLGQNMLYFDKNGEHFYDQISALHKSIRGSDPDASLYWAVRMMAAGCDPVYIARRLLRIASEDIGNADLRAMTIAREAWEAFVRLGHPEGELAIAQAVIYLAVAPKSNAVYSAYKSALAKVRESSGYAVPKHLRNAPTKLMKTEGYGEGYRYAHDEEGAFAEGESYFPEALNGTRFYYPVDRGLEIKISEKLTRLRQRNQQSDKRRY
jgi:putative ATPase